MCYSDVLYLYMKIYLIRHCLEPFEFLKHGFLCAFSWSNISYDLKIERKTCRVQFHMYLNNKWWLNFQIVCEPWDFFMWFFIFRLSLNLSYQTWDLRLPWPEGPLPAASFWSVNTAEVLPPSTTIYWGHSLVSNCIGAFKIFFWSMTSKLDIYN